MLKLIRRYKLILLVIGGVFLMIAFVAPQAIEQIGRQQMGRTVAYLGDQRISAGDMQQAAVEFGIARQLAAVLQAPVFGENERHWLLLSEAADRAGLVDEGGRGRELLARLSSEEPNIYQFLLAGGGRMSEQDMARAVSKALGVLQLRDLYQRAPKVSETLALHESRRALDEAVVDYLLIPGEYAPEARELAVSEGDLVEHFERFRDVRPEQSDRGIGYVLPPRVKLEYLKIDRAAVMEAAPVRPLDVLEAYRASPETYPEGRDEEDEEVRREARQVVLQRVEEDLRQAEANRIIDEAAEVMRRAIYQESAGLSRDGRYLRTAGERVGPPLEEIADMLVDELTRSVRERTGSPGFNMPRPEVAILDGRWRTEEELRQLEGIGRAQIRLAGGRSAPFPEYAMQVREIAGPNDARLQVGVPAVETPAIDAQRSRYFFTILDARPDGPAQSLGEVREQVEEDLRSLRGYEALLERLDEIAERARDAELEELSELFPPPAAEGEEDDLPPLYTRTDVHVTREIARSLPRAQVEAIRRQASMMGQALPADFGASPEVNLDAFREEVMALAGTLDPRQPVSEAPLEHRTLVVPLARVRAVAVARIQGFTPTTIERYRTQVEQVASRAQQRELIEAQERAGEDPFSFAALSRRMGFRERRGEREEAEG